MVRATGETRKSRHHGYKASLGAQSSYLQFTSECKKWARAEQDAAAKEAERITMMRLME